MNDLLGSLVQGSQKANNIMSLGGGSLQMVSEPPSNVKPCGTGASHDVALTRKSGV
jgi:hypothetical protein